MKHESTIHQMLTIYHESWMNDQDKAEMDRESLRLMGKTMEQLDEDIEQGVRNGYSPETQVKLAQVFIKMIKLGGKTG